VVDSSEVAIEPDVTCFVGKNESGKTAFLEALWRLNPHIPTKFIPLKDYPRWRYSRDKKAGLVETTVPVEAVFELDEGEVSRIQETFGSQALNSRSLRAHRDYENRLLIAADVDPLRVLEHVMQALPEGVLRSAVTQEKSVESIAEAWKSAAAAPGDPAEKLFHDLVERSPAIVVGAALADELPKFFYFGRYSELPGRFPLTRILQTPLEKLDDGERTARSLLELGGGEGANLTAEDYERRVAELEAAANMVTQEVLEYWTQNDRIRVSFDVDKQIESDSYGARLVERYMDVRLHDDRHAFTTNLGTRSSGFRWFFSFIVAFSEMEGRDEDVVILLDEPGLNLHARAQKDLLRFIEERLAPNHHVLFTTHSPFMVDPAHLRRARLVEDRTGEKGAPEGSVITTDVLSIDKDTVFPLQGALGYDLAQHLLIGRENLVVEGTSDLIYLTTLSRHLQDLGRIHLDLATLSVTPAGSAANVPTFVALLGGHLHLTVLVDSDSRANQRISDMVSRGMLHSKRLIFVGGITGAKQADIEDLFEPAEYLKLYNAAFGDDLAEGDLPPDARPLVKRIEVARSAFDHGRPAEVLMRKAEEHLPSLSEATLRRFELLFEKVNASL
jgi:energy-coupling factor transporter ATP-binding protein EcfA2